MAQPTRVHTVVRPCGAETLLCKVVCVMEALLGLGLQDMLLQCPAVQHLLLHVLLVLLPAHFAALSPVAT